MGRGFSLRSVSAALEGATGIGVSTRVVALLTLTAFINFVDRGNLATAGLLIRDQFALSKSQLGVPLAAFSVSCTPGQLPTGWLVRLDSGPHFYRRLQMLLDVQRNVGAVGRT